MRGCLSGDSQQGEHKAEGLTKKGKPPAAPDGELTAWDNSPLSEAIREKSITAGAVLIAEKPMLVVAVPLVSNGNPTGVMTLVLDEVSLKLDLPPGMSELFSKIGAFTSRP